jgi:nitrate reductase alpha subunit
MLTNKVVELENSGSETEDVDIFEQSIFTIFAEARNQHGEPGHYVLYKSDVYGDIKLRLSDPDKENNSLFSHFLWNARNIAPSAGYKVFFMTRRLLRISAWGEGANEGSTCGRFVWEYRRVFKLLR